MKNRNKILGLIFFAVAFALWGLFFTQFKSNSLELFPSRTFEIYTLTDHEAMGFSTSEVAVSDSLVDAVVNIRSGKAFPFAGFGFNLMSQDGRPAGYMDLSRFDSLEVEVSTVRMNISFIDGRARSNVTISTVSLAAWIKSCIVTSGFSVNSEL